MAILPGGFLTLPLTASLSPASACALWQTLFKNVVQISFLSTLNCQEYVLKCQINDLPYFIPGIGIVFNKLGNKGKIFETGNYVSVLFNARKRR